jgi:hypothetical protein
VSADAIRAPRHVCHGNHDQLLSFCQQRSVGEDLLTERQKSVLYIGSERPAFLGKLATREGIGIPPF